MKELVNDGFAKVVKPYIDAQNKKSREIIAPVEVSPAEAAHSIGDQIIFDGILYDVIAPIAVDDPLTATGAGANIEPADNIYEQIEAQKAEIQTVRAQAAANNKSTQEMIAPVEEDETDASRAYEIGEQLILDGILYDVIDDIAQHGIITAEGAGANIEEADTIAEQIKNKTITTDAVPTQGSTNPVQSGGTFDAILDEAKTRGELGAKNILPFNLAEIKALNTNGTWADNVYTYRGVAFTVNLDGTISATGTATGGNASIKLFAASSNYEMLGKEVILTGCPSNGSASTYRIQAYRMASADGSTGTYFDDGAGTDAFTVLNDARETVGSFAVAVYENATVTNLLFKPMVRLASDPDATYQPYAKTNRELTAENQTLTKYANAQSNPNLLDNPWFTVNQRGKTSLIEGVDVYTVDRWMKSASTITFALDNGRVSLTNTGTATPEFRQRIENDYAEKYLDGKTLTLSVKQNGVIHSATGIYHYSENETPISIDLGNCRCELRNLPSATSRCFVRIIFKGNTQNVTVSGFESVKLELGDVSTLASDTAPNYATELAKCQRYFAKYDFPQWSSSFLGIASASNNRVSFSIQLPVKMRTTPTLTTSGFTNFKVLNPTHSYAIDSIATYGAMGDFIGSFSAHIDTEVAVLVDNELFKLYQPNNDTQWIAFSADL